MTDNNDSTVIVRAIENAFYQLGRRFVQSDRDAGRLNVADSLHAMAQSIDRLAIAVGQLVPENRGNPRFLVSEKDIVGSGKP